MATNSIGTRLLSISLVSLLAFGPAAPALAAATPPGGKVIVLKGEAYVRDAAGKTRRLQVGDRVAPGSAIGTNTDTVVKLLMADLTSIRLAPSSTVLFAEVMGDGRSLGVAVMKGRARFKSERLKGAAVPKSGYQLLVGTPSALVGGGGTDFEVIYNAENQVTSTVVYDGQVKMTQTVTEVTPRQASSDDAVDSRPCSVASKDWIRDEIRSSAAQDMGGMDLAPGTKCELSPDSPSLTITQMSPDEIANNSAVISDTSSNVGQGSLGSAGGNSGKGNSDSGGKNGNTADLLNEKVDLGTTKTLDSAPSNVASDKLSNNVPGNKPTPGITGETPAGAPAAPGGNHAPAPPSPPQQDPTQNTVDQLIRPVDKSPVKPTPTVTPTGNTGGGTSPSIPGEAPAGVLSAPGGAKGPTTPTPTAGAGQKNLEIDRVGPPVGWTTNESQFPGVKLKPKSKSEGGNTGIKVVKISPQQFEVLKNENGGKTGTQTTQTTSNSQSPIPPGLDPKNVNDTEGAQQLTGEPQPKSTGTPPANTGGPTPGGFVDLTTGLYMAPLPGSTYDPNTGTYSSPAGTGGVDANGNFKPPAGYAVDPVKGLVSDGSKPSGGPVIPDGWGAPGSPTDGGPVILVLKTGGPGPGMPGPGDGGPPLGPPTGFPPGFPPNDYIPPPFDPGTCQQCIDQNVGKKLKFNITVN